jgi:hypothetical protein
VERFAQHYRGRHAPEDALWWTHHPHRQGPSSAQPPRSVLAELVTALRASGLLALADELEALGDVLLEADAQHAAAALERSSR